MADGVILINTPRDLAPARHLATTDTRMPLGLMYISSFLKERGIRARVIDAEARHYGLSDILGETRAFHPRMIGLNCHTFNRRIVYETAQALRLEFADARIIVGGPHASLEPRSMLDDCPAIDAVVVGEGERASYEIYWATSEELATIPGIRIRSGDAGAIVPRGMPRIENLDMLPYPDLEGLPVEEYLNYADPDLPGLWRRAYLSATRGCPYPCSYCTEGPFWGNRLTGRGADDVIREMDFYRAKYQVENFYFYDDVFTLWGDFRKFCEKLRDCGESPVRLINGRPPAFRWSCSTRIDLVCRETIELMAEGGCREIAFGLESGSERILRGLGKIPKGGFNVDSIEGIVNLCKLNGIRARAHFILGFPNETREDITATVRFALRLRDAGLADANFFVAKAYPGTSMSQKADKRLNEIDPTLPRGAVWDAWSVFDWRGANHLKTRAKLRRFNDIPISSLNEHYDSLELRRLTTRAYDLFFSEASPMDANRIWASFETRG